MKRHYIFASHGTLASGVLNSVELILGKRSNVWTLCAYVEEDVDLSQQVDTLIARIPPEDEIIALTDIFAGSVITSLYVIYRVPIFICWQELTCRWLSISLCRKTMAIPRIP